MKISNQQIDSIVHAIIKKNRESIEKELEDLRKSKEVITLAKKYSQILQQIPVDIRDHLYIDKDQKRFIDAVVSTKTLKTKKLSYEDVRNSIILASIDVKSLDELKQKLKFDF